MTSSPQRLTQVATTQNPEIARLGIARDAKEDAAVYNELVSSIFLFLC